MTRCEVCGKPCEVPKDGRRPFWCVQCISSKVLRSDAARPDGLAWDLPRPRHPRSYIPALLLLAASPAWAIWPFDGAARRRQERVEAEAIAADRQLGRQTVEDATATMALLHEEWRAAEQELADLRRARVRTAIVAASAADDHERLADQVLRHIDSSVKIAEGRARMSGRVGTVAANLEYRQQLSERLQELQGRRRLRADDAVATLVDVIRGIPRHTTALPTEAVLAPVTVPASSRGISIPARVSPAEVEPPPLRSVEAPALTHDGFREAVRRLPGLSEAQPDERELGVWVQDQHDYRYECGAGSPGCTGGDQERRDQP